MPRKQKKTKPLICVFCEGESEVAYANFLQREFQSSFVIKTRKMTSKRGSLKKPSSSFKRMRHIETVLIPSMKSGSSSMWKTIIF